MEGLLGLDCATITCPHCGRENTFPGSSDVPTYTCQGCGKAVEIEGGVAWGSAAISGLWRAELRQLYRRSSGPEWLLGARLG
jgi:transposase-like protein